VLACPAILPRAGRLWSLPAAAPLLGLFGLAGAFCALAGQGRTVARRAGAGALGAWWLILAEPLLGRRLFLGAPEGPQPARAWTDSLVAGVVDGLWPLLQAGTAALLLAWAAAAVVLPWLVRGRSLAVDLLGAGLWSTGLALGGVTAANLAGGAGGARPHGLLVGAVAAGLTALGLRWLGSADPLSPARLPGAVPVPEAARR
jgi:hypothetical protein